MFRIIKKDKSLEKSLPQGHYVHGVRIEKLPIGRYLKAMAAVQNLPELILKGCFPGMKPEEVMAQLNALDEELVYQLMGRLLKVAPEQILLLISELIQVDFNKLLNELTPKELWDVLKAFWELNDMDSFFREAKAALKGKTLPGFNI